LRRWSGFNPGGAGFGGRGISQSLSSNERVIDWGEPGTVGNNFVMGEPFKRSTPITYVGGFSWELGLPLMKLAFYIEVKKKRLHAPRLQSRREE
jgi:hypothetical protein